MTWYRNILAPVEEVLFHGDAVKIGVFQCPAEDNCFPATESIGNNVFVFARRPIWFRRGCADFRFVEPGGVLFHRAGSTIERRLDEGAVDFTYWFAVRPDVYAEALAAHGLTDDRLVDAVPTSPPLRFRIAALIERVRNSEIDHLSFESEALSILDKVCATASVRPETGPNDGARGKTQARLRRVVNRTRAFVDANLAENLGLEAIASEVGASTYHMCRTFKALTGLTIHEYRTRQRLGIVADRLAKGGSENLMRLACDVGFSSHSHLTRLFQSSFGLPPSRVGTLL